MTLKIFRYTFFDLIRHKWSYLYFLFYLLFSFSFLLLNADFSKLTISLLYVILTLHPLFCLTITIIYLYHSRSFVILLLSQPIQRKHIFFGQYLGLAISLSSSLILGLGIPFGLFGFGMAFSEIQLFLILVSVGILLSFIFTILACFISLVYENKIKGFSLAILLWLFLAIVYDGLFLILLGAFKDYPLEKFALIASFLNPLDLARVLILLQLDISALMGYTGAVFKHFLGKPIGTITAIATLLLWILIPFFFFLRKIKAKDF